MPAVLLGGDNHAIPGSFRVYPLSAGLQLFLHLYMYPPYSLHAFCCKICKYLLKIGGRRRITNNAKNSG